MKKLEDYLYYEEKNPDLKIYCGDCLEILPLLPKVDLVVTDPPYNVSLGTKAHSERQKGYDSNGDDLKDYEELIRKVNSIILQKSETCFVTPGNSNQTLWDKPLWTMAWIKDNGVTRTPLTRGQKMNHACWEPVLIYGKLDEPPHFDTIKVNIGLQGDAEGHPCPKPLKLFKHFLNMKSGTVLDPFLGSGTTLLACKEQNRSGIGIEISEKYCAIAKQRLKATTKSLF